MPIAQFKFYIVSRPMVIVGKTLIVLSDPEYLYIIKHILDYILGWLIAKIQ